MNCQHHKASAEKEVEASSIYACLPIRILALDQATTPDTSITITNGTKVPEQEPPSSLFKVSKDAKR
eukprot:m.110583 g.110583  ORF g.110583 m.110583 type:complete len:67 (+) comp15371_c0_seq1:1236-1436(+)